METHEKECCIRGYHVYYSIWAAAVREELVCEREPRNSTDRYAVALKKDGTIIDTFPGRYLGCVPFFLEEVVLFGVQCLEHDAIQWICPKVVWEFRAW